MGKDNGYANITPLYGQGTQRLMSFIMTPRHKRKLKLTLVAVVTMALPLISELEITTRRL